MRDDHPAGLTLIHGDGATVLSMEEGRKRRKKNKSGVFGPQLGDETMFLNPQRNVIQEAWRVARLRFPNDRDAATEEYRRLLEEHGARKAKVEGQVKNTKAAYDRFMSDSNLWK